MPTTTTHAGTLIRTVKDKAYAVLVELDLEATTNPYMAYLAEKEDECNFGKTPEEAVAELCRLLRDQRWVISYLPLNAPPAAPSTPLDALQTAQREWADEVFPQSTADSVVAHLKAEFKEFSDAPSAEEAADIALLLLAYANKSGFRLVEAVEQKFATNRARTWEPHPDGYHRHEQGAPA